jgi:hypothetical protein
VVDAFQHAPSLRAVVLVHIPPALILLPWAQLTQFTGHWFEGTDCLHVLRAAPSLVECTFTTSGREGIPIKTALLPPHRHLKILSLTRATVCLDLLCTLTLPALKELEFNNSGDGYRNEPELHAPFIEFLVRSRPSLRRLSMVHAYQRLVHCFPFLHALTTLEMADLAGDDLPNLLHALMGSHETSEVVLPNLRTLVVSLLESHRGTPSIVDYGEVADALGRRWYQNGHGHTDDSLNSGSRPLYVRLESFQMTWTSYGGNTDLLSPPTNFRVNRPRFVELVDAGMRISVQATVENSELPATRAWI